MKKYLLTILKFALGAAIIAWLLSTIDPEQYAELRDRPKNWPLLAASFSLCFIAVCITFFRWWLLVRSLDLPFRIRDAFRLGFLGYLMNFVSVGIVGGDLFKAFFIAREQPGRRTEAVATVLTDRVMGLYALLVVTSGAVLLGAFDSASPTITAVCNMTLLVTLIGAISIAILLMPGVTSERSINYVEGLPFVGQVGARVMSAIRVYRSRPFVLFITAIISLVVHVMLAIGIYLAATGMFETTPTLAEHLVIVPLANVAGALPFTPAGLGTFEVAMEQLYRAASQTSDGILVALAYRLITIVIAGVGGIVYLTSRRELQHMMEDADQASSKTTSPADPAPESVACSPTS